MLPDPWAAPLRKECLISAALVQRAEVGRAELNVSGEGGLAEIQEVRIRHPDVVVTIKHAGSSGWVWKACLINSFNLCCGQGPAPEGDVVRVGLGRVRCCWLHRQ